MSDEFAAIAATIRSKRFRYGDEDSLQEGLAEALRAEGYEPIREAPVDRGRVDLLVGRVAIEVKVSGRPDEVLRQVKRYLASDRIDALVLVTNRVRHNFMPAEVSGKPVAVVALAAAGL